MDKIYNCSSKCISVEKDWMHSDGVAHSYANILHSAKLCEDTDNRWNWSVHFLKVSKKRLLNTIKVKTADSDGEN